jgi:hypothetical protein
MPKLPFTPIRVREEAVFGRPETPAESQEITCTARLWLNINIPTTRTVRPRISIDLGIAKSNARCYL